MGASLAVVKGDTPSNPHPSGGMLRRALAFGLPVLTVLAGLGGVIAGLGEPTLSGVSLEPPGGHVVWVDRGSLAWGAGIRPGQLVVAQSDASEVRGWSIITTDEAGDHALTANAVAATMRLGIAPSALATLLGLLGAVSARGHHRRAELLGAVALSLAAVPFAAVHVQPWAWATGLAAAISSALWLGRWSSARRIAIAGLAISVAIGAVGAASLASGTTVEADVFRIQFAWSTVLGMAVAAWGLGMTPRAIARRSAQLRVADVAALTVLLGSTIVVALILAPPWWALAVGLIAGGLLYGRARQGLRALIDRAIFAEDRERVSIASAEQERARLSRELHDDPLQALTGVIIRLEDRPDTQQEREALRTVAGQLRTIASALHPPVLDDLGLVPAMESLFAEPGPVPVRIDVANAAGYRRSERPPFEVELASYRIVAEATTNALRHSGCGEIIVRGHVSPEAVVIDVVDDGRGFDPDDLERALREGHLGVASMRRRAETIDALLSHDSADGRGTVVSLRWSA